MPSGQVARLVSSLQRLVWAVLLRRSGTPGGARLGPSTFASLPLLLAGRPSPRTLKTALRDFLKAAGRNSPWRMS